jgi:hypothetical protein
LSDLPTARDYLKSSVRLLIWCKACRHQIEIGFPSLVEQGKGNVPIVHLKFRCTNCGSRLTDSVVSGSHLGPKRISAMEREAKSPTVTTVVRLAQALGVSASEWCGGKVVREAVPM